MGKCCRNMLYVSFCHQMKLIQFYKMPFVGYFYGLLITLLSNAFVFMMRLFAYLPPLLLYMKNP